MNKKLGITEGPWEVVAYSVGESMDHYHRCPTGALGYKPWKEKHGDDIMRYNKEDADVIAVAPEMLQALIDDVKHDTKHMSKDDVEFIMQMDKPLGMHRVIARNIKLIEKATDKTWEEVKALV